MKKICLLVLILFPVLLFASPLTVIPHVSPPPPNTSSRGNQVFSYSPLEEIQNLMILISFSENQGWGKPVKTEEQNFMEQVRDALQKGWLPYGPIQIAYSSYYDLGKGFYHYWQIFVYTGTKK